MFFHVGASRFQVKRFFGHGAVPSISARGWSPRGPAFGFPHRRGRTRDASVCRPCPAPRDGVDAHEPVPELRNHDPHARDAAAVGLPLLPPGAGAGCRPAAPRGGDGAALGRGSRGAPPCAVPPAPRGAGDGDRPDRAVPAGLGGVRAAAEHRELFLPAVRFDLFGDGGVVRHHAVPVRGVLPCAGGFGVRADGDGAGAVLQRGRGDTDDDRAHLRLALQSREAGGGVRERRLVGRFAPPHAGCADAAPEPGGGELRAQPGAVPCVGDRDVPRARGVHGVRGLGHVRVPGVAEQVDAGVRGPDGGGGFRGTAISKTRT